MVNKPGIIPLRVNEEELKILNTYLTKKDPTATQIKTILFEYFRESKGYKGEKNLNFGEIASNLFEKTDDLGAQIRSVAADTGKIRQQIKDIVVFEDSIRNYNDNINRKQAEIDEKMKNQELRMDKIEKDIEEVKKNTSTVVDGIDYLVKIYNEIVNALKK
ncbi:MAG: hypothetical protein HPY53_12425 [Brevinematales bacterium]|nr:hypothetical protein [Brevinematales bacterium]